MEQHDWTYYAFVGACFALALFIRWRRRLGKTQRLRLGTLWIVPTIFLALAIFIFSQFPRRVARSAGCGWGLGLIAGSARSAGSAAGWSRSASIPKRGLLNQRSSPAAR